MSKSKKQIIHRAMYHPFYEPDENWLKLQLLYWDSIGRIVPNTMQDLYGDDYFENKYKISSAFCPAIEPIWEDTLFFDKHKISLKNAFRSIGQRRFPSFSVAGKAIQPNKPAKQINQIRIANRQNLKYLKEFGIHEDKAPEWLFKYLIRNGLAISQPEYVYGEKYLVNSEAASLILSCLGSSMAERRAMDVITNQKSRFYLTAASEVSRSQMDRPNNFAPSYLAFLTLEKFVPDVKKISLPEIIKIREEYTIQRNAFHNTINEVAIKHRLELIIDQKVFNEKMTDAIQEYNTNLIKFESTIRRSLSYIKDWKFQAFGGMLGLATIAGGVGPLVIAAKAVGGGLSLIKTISPDDINNQQFRSHQFIEKINDRISNIGMARGIKPFLQHYRQDWGRY
jgi:hypothetical protein